MSKQAFQALLPEISQLVESEMGLHYPPDRWPDLQRGLRVAGGQLGFQDVEQFTH